MIWDLVSVKMIASFGGHVQLLALSTDFITHFFFLFEKSRGTFPSGVVYLSRIIKYHRLWVGTVINQLTYSGCQWRHCMLASERSDRSIRGRALLSSNPRHCITLPRVLEKCCKTSRGEKLSLKLEKFVPAFLRFKVCWEKSLRSIDYIQFFVLVESELLYFSPICFHRTWCKLMSHQQK